MGHVSGDHKVAFGKSKTGSVLFIDIGEHKARRCLGLFQSRRVGNVDLFEGHVVLTNVSGKESPEARRVQFSVPSGQNARAMAAGLTSCVHAADRLMYPSWNGVDVVGNNNILDITQKIKNFGTTGESEKNAHDPSVVRTSLDMNEFYARKAKKNEEREKKVMIPSLIPLDIKMSDFVPGAEAMAAARKVVGPAQKMGYGPLHAPRIDEDLAKEALVAIAAPSASAMDFYGGANLPNESSDTRRGDRLQAAKSYPVLAEMFSSTRMIFDKIDTRQPIQADIIEMTGLTKGALKRLSKIDLPFNVADGEYQDVTTDQLGVNRVSKFVVNGDISLSQALEALRDLPPDWVPQTNEAWTAYTEVLGGLAIPLSQIIEVPIKDLLSASKGDWVSFKKTLAKAADVPADKFSRKQMSALAGEILTMSESFARTAIMPMFRDVIKRASADANLVRYQETMDNVIEQAVSLAPHLIIGKAKSPMVALLEAERRFISRDNAIHEIAYNREVGDVAEQEISEAERKMGDLAGNRAFPVVRETFVASNGYVVEPFRNEKDMQDEGRLMGHCVGTFHVGYGSNGDFHYFSVRHPDTMDDAKQRGTLRIGPISPGAQIKKIEFRSKSNSAVSSACDRAYEEWVATFLPEQIDEAGMRMEAWRDFRKKNGLSNGSYRAPTPDEIWQRKTGVNFVVPGVAGRLWDEWSQNVLSGWPSGNPEVLFRNAEIRNMLGALSPQTAEFLVQEAEQRKQQEAPAPNM